MNQNQELLWKRIIRDMKRDKVISVIDVGAEPYKFTKIIDRNGFVVEAIDKDQQDIEKPMHIKRCYDAAVFTEVIEHLPNNPLLALRNIYNMLYDNGTLYMTTPNMYQPNRIWKYVRGKGTTDPIVVFTKYAEHGYVGHVREYCKHEIRRMLEYAGFKDITIELFPSKLNPWRIYAKARK